MQESARRMSVRALLESDRRTTTRCVGASWVEKRSVAAHRARKKGLLGDRRWMEVRESD